MSTRVKINRLATGIPGLDAILGGGIPELSFNLIVGPPGCGKTTLAHQMMFSMATAERPALFVTILGEPPVKMLRYQQQFDFFDAAAIGESVHFLNLSEEAQSGDLDRVLERITREVVSRNPRCIFVDSFRSVVAASQAAGNAESAMQDFVQQLGMLMTNWQATTFLIGEYLTEKEPNPVLTVADGLIWLNQSVDGNSMVRKLEVKKMRGQPTLPGLHTYRISGQGLTVFAPGRAMLGEDEEVLAPLDGRASMGNAALDAMMCGGLPRGYSLLVAGPSGSGKSILAAQFLAEGARQGETGVIAVFEQNPRRSRHRAVAELVASGRVGLVDAHAPDLSIAEVLGLLLAEIRRLKATRVVIDSLSGFELALAPTFRSDFRDNLSRLVATLSAVGVTVVMTCELEDRYTDLRFSPYGTAYMTDAIIVQRYIEVDSELLRMMAVVKVRASNHSRELRRYSIDADGIRLGAKLTGLAGLLGGRPKDDTRQRDGTPGNGRGDAEASDPGPA